MSSEICHQKNLAEYADLGIQLQQCKFLDQEYTQLILRTQGDWDEAQLASDEHLRAILVPIRQMLSSGEQTYFRRIHNLIIKSAPHGLAKKHPIELQRLIDNDLTSWFPTPDTPYPEDPALLIKHFLNGEYFHTKSNKQSKPHQEAIEKWYSKVGYEKTHWLFQTKIHDIGVYLIQHAYNGIAALRYLKSINTQNNTKLSVSDDCARLIGLDSEKRKVSRGFRYEDDIAYPERFKRTLDSNEYSQLKAFLSKCDLIDAVASTAPEMPLSIESLMKSNGISWIQNSDLTNDEYIYFGTIASPYYGRLNGFWKQQADKTISFGQDALLLLDIALAESRSSAARPRSLTRRLSHIKNTLALCDQWFWEVRDEDGKQIYSRYGTGDFNKLFPSD